MPRKGSFEGRGKEGERLIETVDKRIFLVLGAILGAVMNFGLTNLYVFFYSARGANSYMAQFYIISVALTLVLFANLASKERNINSLLQGYAISLLILIPIFTF